ncbi:cation efflux system protein [Neoasaia chiangmaiensis NBRC 101099]|uniref:Cation transporter n=1 Tax=Neoasaia chiangmaiensis TaxID=320497 RepID=A0A1U9KU89_9PROT|nr:cation diffusion facilitator family transporter [Neoasaia chiangmaiensis]AQS89414.1 cation transporter [Neoasaia chiangmaiensis]GBR38730.1 cation efflux system protein [Neoasaia chiangmaiensis NBRC 101099]GEN15759.1 cadmium transporter [Neoasaia chiangmaiensis]
MRPDGKLRLGWWSLAVSLLVLGLKYLAWRVSGSAALLSDAIETIINVAAAIGALWALTVASRPPDENHNYGHEKAEYLSAVMEGVLVILTAIGIAVVAWQDWWTPTPLLAPWRGVALNALGGLVNLGWGLALVRAGRQRRSPALTANGRHVISDVWTTVALVIGVSLIPITGYLRLDAIISGLVAVNVLRVGFEMTRRSIAGLMDEAPGSEMMQAARAVISETAEGALEAHDLRFRSAGSISFIDFHLVVPGEMRVQDAHVICDRIEHALRRHFGRAVIHIHVEPEDKAKQTGVPVVP